MQKQYGEHLPPKNINTMFLTGTVSKKFTICLVVGLTIFIGLFFFLPPLGRISPKAERVVREAKLIHWYHRANYFLGKKGVMPKSLYDVSLFEDGGIACVKVSFPQNFSDEQQVELLRDPEQFFQEVEYVLAAHQHGWVIMELKSGERYPHRLMIDEKGDIKELRELK